MPADIQTRQWAHLKNSTKIPQWESHCGIYFVRENVRAVWYTDLLSGLSAPNCARLHNWGLTNSRDRNIIVSGSGIASGSNSGTPSNTF